MNQCLVHWTIDIVAQSPEEAARQALEIMCDPDSIATWFEVDDETGRSWQIDLHINTPIDSSETSQDDV